MMHMAEIFDTLPADVQDMWWSDSEVDLGLGLSVIGLEQLRLYFQLLVTLLPSYLSCSATVLTCSVCATWFNTALCASECTLSMGAECASLVSSSFMTTMQTLLT